MYRIPVAPFGRNDPLITQQNQCQQLLQSARHLQGLKAAPGLRLPVQEHISSGQCHFMQAVGHRLGSWATRGVQQW